MTQIWGCTYAHPLWCRATKFCVVSSLWVGEMLIWNALIPIQSGWFSVNILHGHLTQGQVFSKEGSIPRLSRASRFDDQSWARKDFYRFASSPYPGAAVALHSQEISLSFCMSPLTLCVTAVLYLYIFLFVTFSVFLTVKLKDVSCMCIKSEVLLASPVPKYTGVAQCQKMGHVCVPTTYLNIGCVCYDSFSK